MEGESVSKISHDVVTVCPETDNDSSGAISQDPDRNRSLRAGLTGRPDEVDGSEGADCVRDVVGAVGKRGSSSGHDLEEGVEMLGLVVKVGGAGVHVDNVTSESRFATLLGNNILVDSVHEGGPESLWKVLWEIPWSNIGLLDVGKLGIGMGVGNLGGLEIGGLNLAIGNGTLEIMSGLEMLHVGNGGGLEVGAFKILASCVTLVIVLDDLNFGWWLWDWSALEEEWTVENVVPLKSPVFLFELAVKVWNEENSNQGGDGDGNTENATKQLSSSPAVNFKGWSL